MMQEGKFGVIEAVWLIVITLTAKVFYTSPATAMKIVGTTSWYMTIISALTAAVGFTFCYFLLKAFPNKNLLEIYDSVAGRFFGAIFAFLLVGIFLATIVVNLREFTDVIKIYAYRDSPPAYILILVMIAVATLSFLGLETIVRYSKFIGYFLAFGLIAIILLSAQNYEVNRIFPIFGHGIKTTLINGIERSSGYGEVIIIAIFASCLQGIKHIKKTGYLSLLFCGIVVSFTLLSFTLSFSYVVGQELTAPIYVQASLIEYGSFFQRLEPLFFFIWNLTTLISITAMFYTVLYIYCHIFRLTDKRPLIIPLSIIIIFLAIAPESMLLVTSVFEQTLRAYGGLFFFVPPIIAIIIAKVRKKGGFAKNA
jgi:spore germination protein (amino acid permease)